MRLNNFRVLFLATIVLTFCKCDEFDVGVIFTVHKNDSTSFAWEFGSDLTSQGCDVDGKYAIIVHGWMDGGNTWSKALVDKLLKYRGGCVINVNWGKYSQIFNYPRIVQFYHPKIANAIKNRLQKLEQLGVSPDNMFMYGYSIGAWLVIDAAISFGEGKIAQIDVCEKVGVGYGNRINISKKAAKNVQCLHTSSIIGSKVCDCHQDWLLGRCGSQQPAASPIAWFFCQLGFCPKSYVPRFAHELCNDFYISAFENDFLANNYFNCQGVLSSQALPPKFKMGYMETRRSSAIVGNIAAPTSAVPPYN